MPQWKLNIFVNATKTRIANCENLDDVLNSYTKLTNSERDEIRNAIL